MEPASLNRRDVLKLGLAVAAGGALAVAEPLTASAAPLVHPTGGKFVAFSPPILDPFEDELKETFFQEPLAGVADLLEAANGGVLPNGTVYPQVTGDDALTTYRNSLERIVALQQRNSPNNKQFPPQLYYVLKIQQARHAFHNKPPYAAGSVIWGYDGRYPGPTFQSRHKVPILVRIINEVYFDENGDPRPEGPVFGGFGDPRFSTHLHNGHTASESDGNPADFYPPAFDPSDRPAYPQAVQRLRFRDHHYAFFRAGLNPRRAGQAAPNEQDGDPAESLSTLWYHDHALHRTAQNTYKGLVGMHLVYDELDTGNELDPAPAYGLPSGKYDVPLLFQDKLFQLVSDGAGGQVAELHLPKTRPPETPPARPDPINDGFLGDVVAVNGQLKPKLSVERRRYRFRLVNGGPSRFYQFFLVKRANLTTSLPVNQGFTQIGNDESLLEKAYEVPAADGLLLSVAERAEIVIDFSQYAIGDELYLVNRLKMQNGGKGPEFKLKASPGSAPRFDKYVTLTPVGADDKGDYVLKFHVTADPPGGGDTSRPPTVLRPRPALPKLAFKDAAIAATKGQTVVFRQAEVGGGGNHGIVFDDPARVLLKTDAPGSKPNAVLEQIDTLGLYGTSVSPGSGGLVEMARFMVREHLGAPLAFHCVDHPTTKGRLEQGGAGETKSDLHEITIDAGPGDQWVCGFQDLAPEEFRKLVNRYREFELNQLNFTDREWTVNGRPFHASPAGSATIGIGRLDVPRNSVVPGEDGPDGEVWTFRNPGGWAHPVHIHLEEFVVLRRRVMVNVDGTTGKESFTSGELPPAYENSKKDVLRLDPGETVQVFIRFRDFLGKYPVHCHNVVHEDHEMMLRFDIVGDW